MRVFSLTNTISTFVAEYNPGQNFAPETDNPLFVGRFQLEGDSFRSLVRFRLDHLTGDLPVLTRVELAFIQLYLYRNGIPSGTSAVNLHRVLESWDEKSVSWRSQPSHQNSPEISFIVPTGWIGPIIIDITGLVRNWMDGATANHGFVLIGDEVNNRLLGFLGSGASDQQKRPRLIIKIKDY